MAIVCFFVFFLHPLLVGVYFGWAKVIFKDKSKRAAFGKQPRRVVVNVGARPSFDDGSDITIEVHIIDYKDGMCSRCSIFSFFFTFVSLPNTLPFFFFFF